MAIEEEESGGDVPEWVVTFGDMMSLLLTFFIMLVSMSEIKEEERFQAMVDSMREQFGHEQSVASIVPGDMRPRNSNMSHIASQGRSNRKNTMRGGDKVQAPVGEHARVSSIRPGQNATVGGVIYFEGFSSKLNAETKTKLRSIAKQLAGKPQRLEIRGHTMPQPVPEADGLRDDWDLAYERCRVVSEFLIANGIDRKHIRMGVAGKNEPIYTGIDAQKQSKNSRVQVLMWDERVE